MSKVFGSVSTNAPEPVNICEKRVRVIEPTSFDSYTLRGAAFLETYLPTRPREVR
ncbi:hypothetical protein D3C76_1656470 [compost metagenome]